jgi:hypothetical protein
VLRLRGSGPQDNAAGKGPGEGAQLDKQGYADANLWVKRQMAALEERKKQVSRTRQLSPELNPKLNRTSGTALASILHLASICIHLHVCAQPVHVCVCVCVCARACERALWALVGAPDDC